MDKNLLRKRAYENKLMALEKLGAEYPRPLMLKEDYENWRKKLKVEMPSPVNLFKLIIP